SAPAPPAWQQQCPPVSPPPTAFAAATYDAATSSVLLFGGGTVSPDTRSDATWTWDGATWTQQQPAHSPSARTFPALTYDGARGDAVLFGGADPSTPFLGDTWTWD